MHFQKLRLQEEKWYHDFASACTSIANTKDAFLAAKDAMDTEVLSFIVGKIDQDREKNKFLLEVFATESSSIMSVLNTNRIEGNIKITLLSYHSMS